MPDFNQTSFESKIQTVADSLTTASKLDDAFMSIVAVDQSGTDRANVYPTAASLPDLYTNPVPDGTMFFVDDLNIHLIASNECWMTLGGRIYRNDAAARTIWSWGYNGGHGQLGDGTTVNKSSPVSVVGGFTDWCQVSAGGRHASAVRVNGTLWNWGWGNNGLLASATSSHQSSPVSVIGGFTDWCTTASVYYSTIALRGNGTIWSWGDSSCGILGDNSTLNKTSPVSVVGGFTDWCQLSANNRHALALRTNGTMWAWGAGSTGRLGDNTIVAKSSPVPVVGGFTDWCQVSAGGSHSTAIRTNGTIWTWGSNSNGQLGDDSTVSKSSPVSVVGGFTDWCQASSGRYHTIAIRTNGTLWSWGYNLSGNLGDDTSVGRSSPVSVVGGFTDWCQVSAFSHNLAVRTNGTLWAWGVNNAGRLGDGTTVSRSSPVSVVGGFTDWCQVSANASSVALRVTNI